MTDEEIEKIEDTLLAAAKTFESTFKGEGNGDNVYRGAYRCIQELKAENAELKARLKKAVELPCKLGTEIYAIQCKKIHTYYAAEICVMEGGGFEYIAPTAEEEHLLFGRDVFTTREAAEARLKELQGEKE